MTDGERSVSAAAGIAGRRQRSRRWRLATSNLLGKASNAVTGLSATYGVSANLAGGPPTQNTIAWAMYNGQQPVGGFGRILGAAYVRGVGSNSAAVTLPNTVTLLNTAHTQIVNTVATSDSQIAKFYFANARSTERHPRSPPRDLSKRG
jgi:hypothetical protein